MFSPITPSNVSNSSSIASETSPIHWVLPLFPCRSTIHHFCFVMYLSRIPSQEAAGGVFADLWDKIESTKEQSIMPNMTAAVDIMFGGSAPYTPAVYTSDLTLLIYEARRHRACNWGIIPETYFPSGFGIAMPQPTPFKRYVDDRYGDCPHGNGCWLMGSLV